MPLQPVLRLTIHSTSVCVLSGLPLFVHRSRFYYTHERTFLDGGGESTRGWGENSGVGRVLKGWGEYSRGGESTRGVGRVLCAIHGQAMILELIHLFVTIIIDMDRAGCAFLDSHTHVPGVLGPRARGNVIFL